MVVPDGVHVTNGELREAQLRVAALYHSQSYTRPQNGSPKLGAAPWPSLQWLHEDYRIVLRT